jgi:hypothetical protein
MLLFCDGFDHYATADIPKKWTYLTNGTIASGGRNGGNCLHNPSFLGKTILTADTTFIFGCAIKFSSIGGGLQTIFRLLDTAGSSQTFVFALMATGQLQAIGGVSVASTWVASTGVWYYVECRVTLHDTAGSVEVRVDGTPVINSTGIDTKQSATGGYAVCELSGAITADIDDLYMCDTTGTYNKDFLGDCRVESIFPQTDAVAAGTNHGLTPSTGTDHGALVDDTAPNGDTDYNSGTTAALKDTYNFPNMASSGTVKAVQLVIAARKTDQGTKTVCPVVRSGGTDYDGVTVTPPVGYVYLQQIYETDPNTAVPWTGAGVNALEAGLKIVS